MNDETNNLSESKEVAIADFLIVPDFVTENLPVSNSSDILKGVAEKTKNLVYMLDDAGELAQKSDALAMSKFSRACRTYSASIYKQRTTEAQEDRTKWLGFLDIIDANRQSTIDQFAELIDKKLTDVRERLNQELAVLWEKSGIEADFRKVDITPIVKLSGVFTEKGNLTASTKKFLTDGVTANLARQNLIAARKLIVENRCFKAEIVPPFTPAHFGRDFLADDVVFDEKLDSLIAAEVTRVAEQRAIQLKKNEELVKNALAAQQATADRIANENANKLISEAKSEATLEREAIQADSPDTTKTINRVRPVQPVKPQSGSPFATKQVHVTITFQHTVPASVSDQAARTHLISLLPEKLKNEIVNGN